jgi:hypothetical protein
MLHCRRGAAAGIAARVTGYAAIENRLSGFTAFNCACRGVRLLLISISGPADASGQLGAVALLHGMRGFMRSQVYIGLVAKRHAVARRVRERAHSSAGFRGIAADCRAHAADIVPAKGSLDAVEMWQGLIRVGNTVQRGAGGGFLLQSFGFAGRAFSLHGRFTLLAAPLLLGFTVCALLLYWRLWLFFLFFFGALSALHLHLRPQE